MQATNLQFDSHHYNLLRGAIAGEGVTTNNKDADEQFVLACYAKGEKSAKLQNMQTALDRGANVDSNNSMIWDWNWTDVWIWKNLDGHTAFTLTIQKAANDDEATEYVKWFLGKGANPDKGSQRMNTTPLMTACGLGYVKCASALLEGRAGVNIWDNERETALWYAIRSRSVECIDLLAEYRADFEAINRNGTRPIQEAEFIGDEVVMQRFLDKVGWDESLSPFWLYGPSEDARFAA